MNEVTPRKVDSTAFFAVFPVRAEFYIMTKLLGKRHELLAPKLCLMV